MRYAFDDAELDLVAFELRRGGRRVALEPQAFDVLVHLVRNRDRVVSKEELMDEIWGGRFVSETAVTSRIKQVRRGIGDDGTAQRLIRTVHGRGYHFVAPVLETAEATAPVAERPEVPVHYALSDGLNIAYQTTGSGPIDIVLVPGFVSHLELDWADPRHAHFLDRLSSLGRLIRFDKRGTGLSDRPLGLPDLETRMHDVLAVLDHVGSSRALIFGYSEGAPMAVLFAAAHPERAIGLVLYGGYARRLWAEDYPWAPTPAERERYIERMAHEWAWEADLRAMYPSADEAMARWWGRRARAAATPSTVRALLEMNNQVDVRDALTTVRVPTLVLHRRGDRDSRPEEGRYIADRIRDSRFVELSGGDHFVAAEPDQILDEIEPFVAGLARAAKQGSTPAARTSLAAVVAFGADGLVAFDGPATAIRAALERLRAEPDLRVGIDIAEVVRSGSDVLRAEDQMAAALADQALPGTILVTAAVADLSSGSGLAVRPDGERELGATGRRAVFRVVP